MISWKPQFPSSDTEIWNGFNKHGIIQTINGIKV